MHSFELFFIVLRFLCISRNLLVLRNVDMLLLCENFYCISKVNSFNFLNECENVSSFSTSKTFENLFRRRNHKWSCFLSVKWTTCSKITSHPFEWDVSGNHIDNIDTTKHFIYERICHSGFLSNLKFFDYLNYSDFLFVFQVGETTT